MVDIVESEKCTLEDLESSCERGSTQGAKSPTDAALSISLILAGIVATVCVLCLVFAAYSSHHNNDIFPVKPESSSA